MIVLLLITLFLVAWAVGQVLHFRLAEAREADQAYSKRVIRQLFKSGDLTIKPKTLSRMDMERALYLTPHDHLQIIYNEGMPEWVQAIEDMESQVQQPRYYAVELSSGWAIGYVGKNGEERALYQFSDGGNEWQARGIAAMINLREPDADDINIDEYLYLSRPRIIWGVEQGEPHPKPAIRPKPDAGSAIR